MSVDHERDALNRAALVDHDLDAVICRFPGNVLSLSGYWPVSGNAFIIFPAEGPATLIVDETEVWAVPEGAADEIRTYRAGRIGDPDVYESIERIVREVGRSTGLMQAWIGIEHGSRAVSVGHQAAEPPIGVDAIRRAIGRALPDAGLTFAGPALRHAQAHKTSRDLEHLRTAARVAAEGLQAFRETFEPGRLEIDVALAVEAATTRAGYSLDGVREARAWAQLMTGPQSAEAWVGHPWTSSRRIEAGDLGVLELATVVDGYWSDLTRTLVAGGEVSGEVQEMHDALVSARAHVLDGGRAGMTGSEVDALARQPVERAGFGDLFVHHTGHGLGFSYHERVPLLAPGSIDVVAPGMVTSVEPGLYREGLGGMRLEENVVATQEGLELLGQFPFDLTP